MLTQTLGRTRLRLRDPQAADTCTWLVIAAAHTQLPLAREHVADLRRPWERSAAPRRLTAARVRGAQQRPGIGRHSPGQQANLAGSGVREHA